MHPNSLKNLRNQKVGSKFTKEQLSAGGKKSKRLPLHKKLQKMLDDGELEKIVKVAIDQAKDGNIKAMEFVFDRAYGKAKQTIEMDIETKVTTSPVLRSLSNEKLDQIEKWLREVDANKNLIEAEAKVMDDDDE